MGDQYAISGTFWIAPKKMTYIKRLFMKYGGHFTDAPVAFGKRSLVSFGFFDVTKYNKFNARLACLEQPWI